MSFYWHDEESGHLRRVFDNADASADERDGPLFRTGAFCRKTYENSRGRVFGCQEEALADWITFGRPAGLYYAPGLNSCLKIILKVKDESFFLESWISYHAAIVGLHNIIIVDCGSTEPAHLAMLERCKDTVLVLHYKEHYDNLHSAPGNRAFYRALSRHCRYLTVIDADEFLFAVHGEAISAQGVIARLQGSDELVHAGTWFGNVGEVAVRGDMLDRTKSHSFETSRTAIEDGTFSGKAVIRSDAAILARHVGHNLHVREVVSIMTDASLGSIGIFHFNNLPADLQRKRALKHLRGRNIIPADIQSGGEVDQLVRQLLQKGGQQRSVMKYLRIYDEPVAAPAVAPCSSCILDGITVEYDSMLADRMRAFPFGNMLRERRAALGLDQG